MKSKVAGIASAAVVAAAIIGVAFGATLARAGKQDIVDTAVANGQFKTLAAALNAAGLVNTLKGPGAFTCQSASNFDPLERRVRTVALAPSELVGVAETARARVV